MSKPLGPFFYSLQEVFFFFLERDKVFRIFPITCKQRWYDLIILSFSLVWRFSIYFSYLLALAETSSTMLNSNDGGGTLVLFLILGRKPSAFQLLGMVLAVLVINDLYYIPLIPKCWEFLSWKNVEFCQMLFLYLLINGVIFFSFIFSLELEL